MQRLEDQITQIEAEIKYVREKVEKENEPALVLALRQELAALRQEKVLVMQQQQNQGENSRLMPQSCVAMHGEIVTSQRNLRPLLKQSNESHACISRPFIAMSYLISIEPLIVPVYARCFCLYVVLLSMRHSNHNSHGNRRNRRRRRTTSAWSAASSW